MRWMLVIGGLSLPAGAWGQEVAEPSAPAPVVDAAGVPVVDAGGVPAGDPGSLPATHLSYRIDVELDPVGRAVSGTAQIRWRNRWTRPVTSVPLHLYLNAFSHEDTTWMRGVPFRRFDRDDFLKAWEDPWGWIDLTSVKQAVPDGAAGGIEAIWQPMSPDDGNPHDSTLVGVTLPKPVPPGGELVLTVKWKGRAPVAIARTGCVGGFCLMAQWFPKIAVLEHWKPGGGKTGTRPPWALRQFHGLTEFYADFADYEVQITVPAGHLVAATGRASDVPTLAPGKQTVTYRQAAVHDFAWLTGPRDSLAEQTHVHTPPIRRAVPVSVRYIVPAGLEHQIPRLRGAVEASLDLMGRRIGPYPYDVLTVTAPPSYAGRTGGMEYPTFITGASADVKWDRWPWHDVYIPELVAAHEFGHQYFYGLFANDERREALLDEGFNTFFEGEIFHEAYGGSAGTFLGRRIEAASMRASGLARSAKRIRSPMGAQPSFLFDASSAGAQFYPRPATTLATAQAYRSTRVTDLVFKRWYRQRVFAHPTLDQFYEVAEHAGGADLSDFLREAFSAPEVPNFKVVKAEVKGWKAPRGRVVLAEGPVLVTTDSRGEEHKETALDPAAAEGGGDVLMEVTDPGWYRHGQRGEGSIVRRLLQAERSDPDEGYEAGDGWKESKVRIDGPAWDHLPVAVRFRFADGAVLLDDWDGKSPWRRYRFLRKAPLTDVRIDPEGKARVDVLPHDNARLVEPDPRMKSDWGLWIAAVSQWLAAGLSLWL